MYYGTGDPTAWQVFVARLAKNRPVSECPFQTPRYVIKFRDVSTDNPLRFSPVRSMVVIAVDAEQAREKFMGPDCGYEIVSIERMAKRSQAVRS
jgi:hypothetical protein